MLNLMSLVFLLVCVVFSVNCVILSFGPCLFNAFESCAENSIHYYLYSSDRPNEPHKLDNSNPWIPSHFNLSRSTKVILHGYAGSLEFNATADIRREYLRVPYTNVLAVDWGELATLPCYPAAAFNTLHVGHCTASMLLTLEQLDAGFESSIVHLVGFSLGAHAAAFTANYLLGWTGKLQRRITGLDPALPFFATPKTSWKLDASDAKFVDVIHTDSGHFGTFEQVGHVDFYVNGGSRQPACRDEQYEHLCSHLAASAYFAESINSAVGFSGSKCPSYIYHLLGWCPADEEDILEPKAVMGEPAITGISGIYYVETEVRPPFAKG